MLYLLLVVGLCVIERNRKIYNDQENVLIHSLITENMKENLPFHMTRLVW